VSEGDRTWWLARADDDIHLLPGVANRHGLIAGATGTGKTVSLRVLAEAFSDGGVPVFLADIKGDLSGLAAVGGDHPKVRERAAQFGLGDDFYRSYPVTFWDLFGEAGHPVRTTVSEMGPQLLARILGLNETQQGVLNLIFKVADDQGLLLLDLKDLRAMATFVADHAAEFRTRYGNVSAASIGAIQRGLLVIEEQGGDGFFGEPALDLDDLMQTGADGRGMINILAADRLMRAPRLYATFLLWLLAELFERLPEVGDPPKPKLVFCFDEAHLLFDDAPKALVDQIEQVVRLIRSKGVGVYFITQNPIDLPDSVLGQLGLKIQHALRAFTPRDQKAVRSAAQTFRVNPQLNVETAILELGVGAHRRQRRLAHRQHRRLPRFCHPLRAHLPAGREAAVVYMRFGRHEPLVQPAPNVVTYKLDACAVSNPLPPASTPSSPKRGAAPSTSSTASPTCFRHGPPI
jgi:uncharacterized protein